MYDDSARLAFEYAIHARTNTDFLLLYYSVVTRQIRMLLCNSSIHKPLRSGTGIVLVNLRRLPLELAASLSGHDSMQWLVRLHLLQLMPLVRGPTLRNLPLLNAPKEKLGLPDWPRRDGSPMSCADGNTVVVGAVYCALRFTFILFCQAVVRRPCSHVGG